MGSSFALIGQHSPYPYIIISRLRHNPRLVKTFLNDNKRKTIACFIYSFFLGNTLIVRYFCKGLKKQEVRVPHKTKTLTELNKKEIIKEAQRDYFYSQNNYIKTAQPTQPLTLFLAIFLLILFLLKPTIFLAIHNSSTPQTLYLLSIHSSPSPSFLISFSSQKYRFYTAIAMLSPYNFIAFTT